MTTYAEVYRKRAPLHTEVAREFVERRFGADLAAVVYETLPTFKRGPRKGLVKGYIHWRKVARGGWYRDPYHPASGSVLYPGTREVQLRVDRGEESLCIIYEGQNPENQTHEQNAAFARRPIRQPFGLTGVLV